MVPAMSVRGTIRYWHLGRYPWEVSYHYWEHCHTQQRFHTFSLGRWEWTIQGRSYVFQVKAEHPDWPGENAVVEIRRGESGWEIRIPSHPEKDVRENFKPLAQYVDYVQEQVNAQLTRQRARKSTV